MLNELAERAHRTAVEHGWWEKEPTFGDVISLMHSELSEALEEFRDGRPHLWHACGAGGMCRKPCPSFTVMEDEKSCPAYDPKPEGVGVELADCLIRILDYCAREGWDIDAIVAEKMDYNETRPYRHGGKRL